MKSADKYLITYITLSNYYTSENCSVVFRGHYTVTRALFQTLTGQEEDLKLSGQVKDGLHDAKG